MNIQLLNFLSSLIGDVFKLLPMKEAELDGANNHVDDYIDSLVINIKGAMVLYSELNDEKDMIYLLNNLAYMKDNKITFKKWRKIILDSTHNIETIYKNYGGDRFGLINSL